MYMFLGSKSVRVLMLSSQCAVEYYPDTTGCYLPSSWTLPSGGYVGNYRHVPLIIYNAKKYCQQL